MESPAQKAGLFLSMTADQLTTYGEALYGERWQSALARDLSVSDRTLRYWLSGRNPPPSNIRLELDSLVRSKIEALEALFETETQG